MQPIRTLIVDDHPATCQGVAALLEVFPEIEVMGTAYNGLEAVEKAVDLEAQAVVMDIKLPELDGIKAAHRIRTDRPETGIVILSNYDESSYLRELLRDGVNGYAYLLKTASIDEIKFAILTVARGGHLVDPQMARKDKRSSRLEGLTPREKDVLEAMAQGLDNKGIAEKLVMQPGTVSMHIANIYSKLEVDRSLAMNPRVAAVLMWHGLLD